MNEFVYLFFHIVNDFKELQTHKYLVESLTYFLFEYFMQEISSNYKSNFSDIDNQVF